MCSGSNEQSSKAGETSESLFEQLSGNKTNRSKILMKNFVAVCPFGLHCAPNSATRAKDHPLVFFSSFFLQFFHDENYFIFFFYNHFFRSFIFEQFNTYLSKITIDSKLDSKASSLRNTLCWFRILESGNLKIAGSE